jgi:hypothetical protein
MSEKNAKVIFESDEDHSVLGLYQLKAYKNYLCYYINANVKDFDAPDSESWYSQLYSPMYLYNIETEQNSEIPVPKGYSNTTYISNVVFLQDKMLFRLYDNLQDHVYDNLEDNKQNGTYKFPIYSINYDLTDEKIWLDNVEQGKWVQTYNDYVILSDASLQYSAYLYTAAASDGDLPFSLDDLPKSCNIEIYSADAKRVSYFVYPMNVSGNFNGFGPDGVNVEFADNGDSWSVYELNFDDVLNCHGEEVKLNLISTRKFGALNKEDN